MRADGGQRDAHSVPAAGEMPAGFRRSARCLQVSDGRREARSVRRPAAGELPGRQRFPQLWGLEEPVRAVLAAWRLLGRRCLLAVERRDEVRLVPWMRFVLDLKFSGTDLHPNDNNIQVRSNGSVGQTGPVASIGKSARVFGPRRWLPCRGTYHLPLGGCPVGMAMCASLRRRLTCQDWIRVCQLQLQPEYVESALTY
jgi:hypothetical protein